MNFNRFNRNEFIIGGTVILFIAGGLGIDAAVRNNEVHTEQVAQQWLQLAADKS